MTEPVRVFISAGENSGDLHAANFIRAVRALRPEVEFEGFGGPRMAAAGCRLHKDMLGLSVMWASFLGHLAAFLGVIRQFYWLLRRNPPAVVVLVDFPGLHFLLARLARARGIPIVYYICPQIWGWAPWRRRKILRLTDLLLVILPFEEEFYRNSRTRVIYVGHPLADDLREIEPRLDPEAVRSASAVPEGGKLIAVLPGSRMQEVLSLAPLLRGILDGMGLEAARHRVVVSCCRPGFRPALESSLKGLATPWRIDEGDSRTIMAACDFALVASGTATLELAYFGKPMLVLYRIPLWQYPFYRTQRMSPYISLVNLLGRGGLVPERVVSRGGAGGLTSLARALLEDGPERSACLERLRALKETAFRPGGTERAAKELIRCLETRGALGPVAAGARP